MTAFGWRSFLLAGAGSVSAINNGLARTPPMGWNTWCTEGHCGLDKCHEDEIKEIATAMQSNGMQAAGYEYLNLDDCTPLARTNSLRSSVQMLG